MLPAAACERHGLETPLSQSRLVLWLPLCLKEGHTEAGTLERGSEQDRGDQGQSRNLTESASSGLVVVTATLH